MEQWIGLVHSKMAWRTHFFLNLAFIAFWKRALQISVPPGLRDSAIAEFIAKSSKLIANVHNCRRFSADFGFRRIPWHHCNAYSVKERLFSTALRSHHDRFTRATLNKRTENGTNTRYSFGLRGADRLSAWAYSHAKNLPITNFFYPVITIGYHIHTNFCEHLQYANMEQARLEDMLQIKEVQVDPDKQVGMGLDEEVFIIGT